MAHTLDVSAGTAAMRVVKHLEHDPSCGAAVWFDPFVTIAGATVGITETQHYRGSDARDEVGAVGSQVGVLRHVRVLKRSRATQRQ